MGLVAIAPAINASRDKKQSLVRRAEGQTMMILTQAQSQSSWICLRVTLPMRMKKTCVGTLNERKNKLGKKHSTRSKKNRNVLIS